MIKLIVTIIVATVGSELLVNEINRRIYLHREMKENKTDKTDKE